MIDKRAFIFAAVLSAVALFSGSARSQSRHQRAAAGALTDLRQCSMLQGSADGKRAGSQRGQSSGIPDTT